LLGADRSEKILKEALAFCIILLCVALSHALSQKQGANVRHIKKISNFERKDVWNIKWADDNPDLLAVMEKARMYILRGTEPEEPVACTAYLCSFHDLQVHCQNESLDLELGKSREDAEAILSEVLSIIWNVT